MACYNRGVKQLNNLSDLQRFSLIIGLISLMIGIVLLITTYTAEIIYNYDTLILAGSLTFAGIVLIVYPCISLMLRR